MVQINVSIHILPTWAEVWAEHGSFGLGLARLGLAWLVWAPFSWEWLVWTRLGSVGNIETPSRNNNTFIPYIFAPPPPLILVRGMTKIQGVQ